METEFQQRKLEPQDRKIIIIPDKPDKFPDVRQDQGKGISILHLEGDNGLEQSKTPFKRRIEQDKDEPMRARPIPETTIPITPWKDHQLNPLRRMKYYFNKKERFNSRLYFYKYIWFILKYTLYLYRF